MTKGGFAISSLKYNGALPVMAPFELAVAEESKDSDLSCKGCGHSLLGCILIDRLIENVYWIGYKWILGNILTLGETINASRYVETLHKLRQALRNERPGREVILQHDNTPPHYARCASEEIEKVGRCVLPHPSYSSDLTPSDYHLSRFVNDKMRGQRFKTIEETQTTANHFLWKAGMKSYHKGIFKLKEWWEKCVQKSRNYVEK